MHFLFLAGYLGSNVAGIETLISRMSKSLLEKGHKITLLTNRASEFHDIFPSDMRIVELGNEFHKFCYYHEARRLWPRLQISRPDVIKSFFLRDSWISTILSSIIKPTPKVLFGNYFPYIFSQSRNPFRNLENRPFLLNLRRNFSDYSILCMDEEQIAQYRRQYGFDRYPTFWPLPIGTPRKNGPSRSPKWGRIVSVSRLEPMKDYNLYMIDIIARLRQKGYLITWDVYGEGSYKDLMKDKIIELGLSDVIRLKGRLEYSNFSEAMRHAYIFIGGGTSIVEAALCGVPGVMALAYDSSGVTYGPLYRYPFGNLGARTRHVPKTTVETEIQRILNFSKKNYKMEVKLNMEYARSYSMDTSIDKFIRIVEKAKVPKISYPFFYYYYGHKLIEFLIKRGREFAR